MSMEAGKILRHYLVDTLKDFYAHAVQGFHVEEQARKVEEWLFNIY